jgi:hypothetical protein
VILVVFQFEKENKYVIVENMYSLYMEILPEINREYKEEFAIKIIAEEKEFHIKDTSVYETSHLIIDNKEQKNNFKLYYIRIHVVIFNMFVETIIYFYGNTNNKKYFAKTIATYFNMNLENISVKSIKQLSSNVNVYLK